MPLFEKHEIAGRHLLKMVGNEEMLRDMGIVSIKTRKRIMSYLRLYTRRVVMKPQTAKLKRPNLLNAFLQFFTCVDSFLFCFVFWGLNFIAWLSIISLRPFTKQVCLG
eukprot:c15423_g2_i1.p2 GENE.c15423_g2_i1~~c15423_g2_i1.p2  ORF type:complete len:108 (+),score=26.19 c15423_g2_i1:235-558(+)